ncbi:MAG: glycosyltransferase family 2 protein [Clostridiales bacterium]
MKKPILSIAIPTYNRANILDISLPNLLDQIENSSFKNEIEIIISDNASDDNTQKVIKKTVRKFNNINYILNTQSYNTGYYGNFKKCRELSTGKYFWLLSDNELIRKNLINIIIENIKKSGEVGIVYLENVVGVDEVSDNLTHINAFLLNEKVYMITLISSIIMLNDQKDDQYVFKKYINNSFLGFILLINALKKNRSILVIKGNVFESIPSKVYFNIFNSWTLDITEALDYMVNCSVINDIQKTKFISGYLEFVIYDHVLNYLYDLKRMKGKYGSPNQIQNLLEKYYGENEVYKCKIQPLFRKKIILLKVKRILKKITKKLNKYLSIAQKSDNNS